MVLLFRVVVGVHRSLSFDLVIFISVLWARIPAHATRMEFFLRLFDHIHVGLEILLC
jgi:hypothetical protein